jgi:hypothetical protein
MATNGQESTMTQQQILTTATLDQLRKTWRHAVAKSDDESLSDKARRVADEIADDVRAEILRRGEVPNPITKSVPLRAYSGWVVDCYEDGTFVARQTNGPALGPVEDSFKDAVHFVKHGEPVLKSRQDEPQGAISWDGQGGTFNEARGPRVS